MGKHISNNKDITRYVQYLMREHGAILERGGKHPYIILDGHRITVPSTPSYRRSIQQFKAYVKRHTRKK